jgi:hypothetical protein
VFVHESDAGTLHRAGLDRLDALLNFDAGEDLTKPGLARWRRRSRVLLADEAGHNHVYYLKRFFSPPLLVQARRLVCHGLGTSHARAEAETAAALGRAGVQTYRVAAFGERVSLGVERASAVLIASLPGESLERWWPGRRWALYEQQRTVQRLSLIEELAAFVARFHASAFVHRDLYFSHVFIDDAAAEARRFALIDLGRVFRPGWRRRRWIVKDLAQLEYSASAAGVSRSDRARFFMTYCRAMRMGDPPRSLAVAVLRKAGRIAARDARRVAGQ